MRSPWMLASRCLRSSRCCCIAATAPFRSRGPGADARTLGHAHHADLAGIDQADGGGRARPAASTRCSCRCAAAATRTTPARSSRARPSWPRKPSFDPLATVIDRRARRRAARSTRGSRSTWCRARSSLPASRDHVIYRAPEWLMVPRELAAEMKKIDLRSPAYVGRLARWTRAHTVDRRRPLHLAAASGRAGSHRGGDRRDRREVRRRRRASRLRAVPERGFRLQPAGDGTVQGGDPAGPERARAARSGGARSARSGRLPEPVSRTLERLPPLAADVAGHQDSHRGEDGAPGRDRQRRGRSRRAAGVRPAACRTGAAGSISRCST